ncbi:hypothetical protein GL981_04150 [Spiroplasma citri]|uniref:Type I restriction modification DNA specificity domain-containing protein n=1 Tax=Spiroplasma citri TaxID=2133 RepID=A0AAJ4EJ96_SPICI|nr:hypothetical protein [Spiroplasma citri]QIA68766.1 hypothetical protein GL298_04120 [Spiroplasma citri]QIA70631.1 hypothetical protein GL981_04150 [Spiroplasma citri]
MNNAIKKIALISDYFNLYLITLFIFFIKPQLFSYYQIFTVKLNDLEFGYRLLPMFYYFLKIIKVRNIKKGIKYITLQEISKKISDGEHSHIKRNNKSGVRYLYGRNIKQGTIKGTINFDSISDYSYISLEDYTNFKRTHLIDNDVLISILGIIGNSAIYKKEYLGIIGIPRHIGTITLLNTFAPISPEYLVAYFRTKLAKHQLYSLTTGNIQQLLSLKNLKNYEIPIPNKTILKQ